MKISAPDLSAELRDAIRSWGWEFVDERPDAILSPAGQAIEIRTRPTAQPDDIIYPPLTEEELTHRIGAAQARQSRLAKRLHDLRSPLNAIQGYAEILAETAEGDALRFASNIRTASELLTSRLESFREEGV